MDEIADTQRAYVKARLKAEKSRDPETIKKIKQAEKLLEKSENEANKTIDPRLKETSEELFRKLQTISNKLGY